MIRWLRVVWPNWLLPVGAFYAVVEGIALALEQLWGLPWPFPEYRPGIVVLWPAAAIYGLYRVGSFHPFGTDHGRWLATTPWTSRKPLPLGPIHLAGQDALLLLLVLAAAWPISGLESLVTLQLFGIAYLVMLAFDLSSTGENLAAYGVGFGVSWIVYRWHDRWFCLVMALLSYGIAYLGLRWSLAHFPWQDASTQPIQPKKVEDEDSVVHPGDLGWPFMALGPKDLAEEKLAPLCNILLGSILAGWWIHVIGSIPKNRWMVPGAALAYACVAFPFARLDRYCNGYKPPLSLWGRLATGRWIIKGYDQVYVAPLLSMWVGVVTLIASGLSGAGPEICLPIGFTISLCVCRSMGPDLATWRLTGNHRIEAPKKLGDAVQVG